MHHLYTPILFPALIHSVERFPSENHLLHLPSANKHYLSDHLSVFELLRYELVSEMLLLLTSKHLVHLPSEDQHHLSDHLSFVELLCYDLVSELVLLLPSHSSALYVFSSVGQYFFLLMLVCSSSSDDCFYGFGKDASIFPRSASDYSCPSVDFPSFEKYISSLLRQIRSQKASIGRVRDFDCSIY